MKRTILLDEEVEEARQAAIYEAGPLAGTAVPGSMCCHEALHMASFLNGAVDAQLCQHPAIAVNPEWFRAAMEAHQILFDLYQAIGAAHLDMRDPDS